MTKEKKNIKIAEACGWRIDDELEDGGVMGSTPGGNWDMLPDYFHDLNSMHEAEEMIRKTHGDTYIQELSLQTNIGAGSAWEWDWAFACATAAQRAEAFGKTLNLW